MASHQHKILFVAHIAFLIKAFKDMSEGESQGISGEKLELIQRILELQNTLHGMTLRYAHGVGPLDISEKSVCPIFNNIRGCHHSHNVCTTIRDPGQNTLTHLD